MHFVDQVRVYVESGHGGGGCCSFHREKFVPNGGPDGGDGGKGGDILFRIDEGLATLLDLRYKKEIKAKKGQPGGGNNKTGASGKATIVRVPPGCLIYDDDTGELLADLTPDLPEVLLAKGGDGGKGNARFVSSINQAPRRTTPGFPGEQFNLRIELKLMADVGIIGYPNVGKSTLIRKISKARPKVADYPFTTLVPNLGVVGTADGQSFVVADIPGLVENAHLGEGLGHQFLRHVERCSILLHIVEFNLERGDDPRKDFETINRELAAHSEVLAQKKQIVALNKVDAGLDEEMIQDARKQFEAQGIPFFAISALSGEGVNALTYELVKHIPRFVNPPKPKKVLPTDFL